MGASQQPLSTTHNTPPPPAAGSFLGASQQPLSTTHNTPPPPPQLLDAIRPLQRGLRATPEDKAAVERLAAQLERLNPTPKPLASPLLNGRWELLYTTSDSILGTKRPALLRPSGPIYQLLDGGALRAANRESAPLFNSVTAQLSPLSASKVAVQFKQFKILGLIPVTAPPSARGELQVRGGAAGGCAAGRSRAGPALHGQAGSSSSSWLPPLPAASDRPPCAPRLPALR